MSRKYLVLLIVVILASCKNDKVVTIDGEILGTKTDEVIIVSNGKLNPVKVQNNKFTYTQDYIHDSRATVLYKGKFWDFYFTKGETKMTLSTKSILENVIEGSSLNAIKKKSELKIASFKNEDDKKAYISNLIKKNSNNFYGFDLLYIDHKMTFTAVELEELFNNFSKEIKESKEGKRFNTTISLMLKSKLGNPFTELAYPNQDGDIVTLSSCVKKNKLVILDFWASWCGPCRQEGRHLKEMYKKYHSKGLEIYGCSIDKSKDKWLKAMKEDANNWVQVISNSDEVSKQYDTSAIPKILVINNDGKVIANNLRGKELEQLVESILVK